MADHEHLSRVEHRKMFNSNSKMYNKPQENDYTFMEEDYERIVDMTPINSRVLVELLPSDGVITGVIRPFHYIKVMRSTVISVGHNVYHKIKPGKTLIHQHRCGLQIGFYGLPNVLRLIPDRLIMAVE